MVQDRINLIPRILELYENGGNIIQFLRSSGGKDLNSIEDILISYEFQAGSYVKFTEANPLHHKAYTQEIANVLKDLGNFASILEVGCGEATTLANVVNKLNIEPLKVMGFDISWSRIKCGIQYLIKKNVHANLFVADLFNIPLADNSVDVLYTSHSMEPNGSREKEALRELYRVTRRHLVLLEPTDEFATEEGKRRMKEHGYVQNLFNIIKDLKYNITTYKPFAITGNPLNPTGLYIITKEEGNESNGFNYCCPISKCELQEYSDHYFSPDSLISYPKIIGIPCLCTSYGILTTHHDQFE